MNFNNQSILFIAPRFFDYETAIENRLLELGAKVDYFDERPSNSVLSKGLIRMYPKLYHKTIESYYHQIFDQTCQKRYDYFLLIKGETIPLQFLSKFKKQHPSTKTIFYAYDSAAEYPKFRELFSAFDRSLTFEPDDADKFKVEFRPFFYLDVYHDPVENIPVKYDISCIGSVHTDRYVVWEKIQKQARRMDLKTFDYFYIPNFPAFILRRCFDSNLKRFAWSKLRFKKLSASEVRQTYAQSFAVVDINKPFQLGVGPRVYEALVSKRKVITTNPQIKNYSFYNPQNILVIDRENPVIPIEFFKTPFVNLPPEELEKMSLDSWLQNVFQ